jgi:hypothetical protein
MVAGIRVSAYGDPLIAAQTLERAHAALDLIRENDARRLPRIRRELRWLAFTDVPGAGYVPLLRVCRVESKEVIDQDPAWLAMIIVHEATHARLCRMGIRDGPFQRERVERACVREELAFARRMGGQEYYIAHIEKGLHTPWWTPAALRTRRNEGLRRLGTPSWIIRLLSLWRVR